MCDDAGVGDDAEVATIVESCTVGDDWFKSYDSTWLEAGGFHLDGALKRALRPHKRFVNQRLVMGVLPTVRLVPSGVKRRARTEQGKF
jgi:hypothetical protein